MNTQEVLNTLKIVGSTLFGVLAMHGYMTKDQASALMADLSTIVPALISAGGIAWSIYSHWNMKKVPENAVAVDPHTAQDARAPVGASAAGKVVGVLLVAFTVSLFLAPDPSMAQGSASGKKVTKAQAVANPITVVQTFTVDDLTAALADAQANNDTAAANCYSALLPIVKSGVANPFPKGLGGFQLLQKARDAKALAASLQSPNGPLAQLNIACAPLVMDVQNTLIQLGIIGGGVAITAGAGGLTLPALSTLIPGL